MSWKQAFAKKKLEQLLEEAAGDNRLKRALGPVTLTALGVGAVIGAGIFVATGSAAKEVAGPALMISYTVAGLACIFAALCYAEFASMAPVAGSAYTYAYTTLGELFAWIIGWDLILEYAVGAATVANGWSGYFQSVLLKMGLVVPVALSGSPYKYDNGHVLPNVVGEYTVQVAQKTMDLDKPARLDGKDGPARGNFWIVTVNELRDGESTPTDVVVGAVGDEKLEAKIKDGKLAVPATQKYLEGKDKELKDKPASWADGSIKPADGVMWVYQYKADQSAKTVVVGPVGGAAVEPLVQNHQHALFNLPAILITALMTIVLVKGIQESASFNAIMVLIKTLAVLFVIFVGAFYVNPDNWTPFAPYGWTGVSFFGFPVHGQSNAGGEPVGMLAGAAIIFFAYIGFDSVSTHAEEAKNPQRDVPIGIIASLVICTILYIAVVAVLTGMVRYTDIHKDAGVSSAFHTAGLPWAELIVSVAGVAGITSVLLVMMLSAPRVFLAMARDGLVPTKFFADVHPKFQTPWKSTIAIGVFVALLSGLLPIDALLHLTNIGTLFAFVIVCTAVLLMRKINPTAARPFRCPLVPIVPLLGIGTCLLLMLSLPAANWWRLFAWLTLGLVIYAFYGRFHSTLGKELVAELAKHGATPHNIIEK